MTSFVLKCIAIISMLIDHFSLLYFNRVTLFNVIGKISFPIFAFQISEGYIHTKDIKRYLLRLFVFFIISQIPFHLFQLLFTTSFSLDIFSTLFLGLLSILIYDKFSNGNLTIVKNIKTNNILVKFIALALVILLCFLSEFLKCDYGFFGVAIIFIFYIFRNHKFYMNILFILASAIKYIIPIITFGFHYMYILLFIGTIISTIFINLYNGKQGRKIKYFFYIFYPFHLLILYFIFN